MRDDFLSQDWAEHHGQLSAFLGGLIDQARVAFERLAARAYDAPWRPDATRLNDPARPTPHQTRDICA
uniref:hypothetical protein n=1 Tax=uncultured Sphingomonas sp. TaxID=158754 RepID=UPI0035C9BF14